MERKTNRTQDDGTAHGPVVTRTRLTREIYVSKKEERRLAGKCGFIGTAFEDIDSAVIQPQDRSDYMRAWRAFYRRHPSHPNHPMWRLEHDELFMPRMNAGDPEAATLFWAYRAILGRAIAEWKHANPQAVPVHPRSADWRPAWDALCDDPDALWPARNKFLMDHETTFRAVPGLYETLREQLHDFMREHYDPVAVTNR